MLVHQNSRKRTFLACDFCRRRRRKCDGVEPVCGMCLKYGRSCNYSYDKDKRKPPSKLYMDALTKKIGYLKEELGKIQSSRSPEGDLRGNDGLSDTKPTTDQESGILQKLEPFGKLNIGEDGQLRFYGPRSSISFIRDKLDLVSQPAETTIINSLNSAAALNLIFSIPISLRDELLDLYFTFQNSSVMVVQQEVFTADLKSYDNQGLEGKYFSIALLNAMLSVGAQFYDRDKTLEPFILNRFYALADYLVLQERECPTVTTVQTCAVLAIYNIFKDREMLAWDYCGMAIRISFGIGLSMKFDIWLQEGDLDNVEDQVRRVTWWGVYVLEKLICNILGRPVAIKKYNITSTFPDGDCIDDHTRWVSEYVRELNPDTYRLTEGQPGRLLSTTTFMIELFMICDEPLNQLHLAFRPQPESELEKIIFDCHLELLEFERGLPKFMRLRLSRRDVILLPHVYMLHLRLNYVQLLLHRIFFIREAQGPSDEDRYSSYRKICCSSANNIVSITKDYVTHYGVETLDFMAPECISAAAMVHLYLQRNIEDSSTVTMAKKNFDYCIWLLHETSVYNFWAARLVKVLYVLANDWCVDLV